MITIIYADHIDDFVPRTIDSIRSLDIFVDECITNYSDAAYSDIQEHQRVYNKVSQGLASPDDVKVVSGRYNQARILLHALHKTGIRVYVERNQMEDQFRVNGRIYMGARNALYQGNLENALKGFREFHTREGLMNGKRDYDLADFLIELQKSNKDRNVGTLRGSGHTSLYHIIRGRNFPARMVFPRMPYQYNLSDQVQRRFIFGKKVNDKEILDGQISLAIATSLIRKNPKMSAYSARLQADDIVSKLSFSDVGELLKYTSENWWPELGERHLHFILGEWLEEKAKLNL